MIKKEPKEIMPLLEFFLITLEFYVMLNFKLITKLKRPLNISTVHYIPALTFNIMSFITYAL